MKIETYSPALLGIQLPEGKALKLLLKYALARYALRREVIEERRQLAELPEGLLMDIGIKREDAVLESRRDPSKLPQDRLMELRRRHHRL